VPPPLAWWNPTRGVWETDTLDLLSPLPVPFSEPWPSSGMTRDGVAYAQPTPAPPTPDSESSSWPILPTPRTTDGTGPAHHGDGGPDLATALLLPTPRASDGAKGGPNQRGSSGDLTISSAVIRLLPTPTAQDAANVAGPSQLDRNTLPLSARARVIGESISPPSAAGRR